jgi:hypothetical protein
MEKRVSKFLFYDEFELINFLIKQFPIITELVVLDSAKLIEKDVEAIILYLIKCIDEFLAEFYKHLIENNDV